MEITIKNASEVLEYLTQAGAIALKSHVEEILTINEEEYPIGSEYSTDNGYGARLFLIKNLKELVEVKAEHSLCGVVPEHEIIIHEDNGVVGMYTLYLTGDDSAVALFVTE